MASARSAPGGKIDPNALAVYWAAHGPTSGTDDWFSETDEKTTLEAAIIKTARQLAGKAPDATTADAALHRAAAVNRTILTPHASAMQRAASAVKDVDVYMQTMRTNGTLSIFNGRYNASGRRRPQAVAAS